MFPTYEDDRNEEADPVGFLYCHIIPRGKKQNEHYPSEQKNSFGKMNIIPRLKIPNNTICS